MTLPRRPSAYVLALLLGLLIGLTYYMAQLLDSPKLGEAARQARERAAEGEPARAGK